jgi:hemolysin activation/secretion protein
MDPKVSFLRSLLTHGSIPIVLLTHPSQARAFPATNESQPLISQIPTLPSQDTLPPSRQPFPEPNLPKPPSEDLLPKPPEQTPAPSSIPSDIPAIIQVKRFEVIGSTVFSPAELAAVTAPYTNRTLTFNELLQVSSAITKLYVDKGYITSGAYLPPQRLEGSVAKIQVLEGTLEGIKITGAKRLNPSYIRSRIALGAKPPLNRDRLLEVLQLLQLNPLISNLSADLSAGTRPGQNLLEIKVKEARTFHPTITLDNGRSPSVGSFRRGIQLSEANLLGQGDAIQVGYANTDGSNALDLKYTWPLNARNGTVSFGYGINFNRVVEPPFNTLDINSNSNYYELALRQPILQTPTQEVGLGLTFTRQASKATLLDELIPFPSLGADSEGNTRVWTLAFSQDWTRRSREQVLALRSEFSAGLDIFDATRNQNTPDGQFFAWRGQGQWVRSLAPDTLFLFRTDIQLADRALVPLAQFGLGGIDSVRGYRQDALLTDSGIFASAEARIPIARFRRIDGLLQIVPFVEMGKGWNLSGRPNPDPSLIGSVGLGLRWQTSDKLSIRLDYGIPLVSIQSSRRTWQESGFYFSVNYTPF